MENPGESCGATCRLSVAIPIYVSVGRDRCSSMIPCSPVSLDSTRNTLPTLVAETDTFAISARVLYGARRWAARRRAWGPLLSNYGWPYLHTKRPLLLKISPISVGTASDIQEFIIPLQGESIILAVL